MNEYAGQVYTVKKARKQHYCHWCGQMIEPGESYNHWLWYCDGSRETIKAHVECYEFAMTDPDDPGYVMFDGDGHRPTEGRGQECRYQDQINGVTMCTKFEDPHIGKPCSSQCKRSVPPEPTQERT